MGVRASMEWTTSRGRCVPGFVGPLCQENVPDCDTRPCANGGQCHDLINDFACTCAPGWTGKDCRYNIDECESNPCKNGGSCHGGDLVNDYECMCLPGYRGKDCSIFGTGPTPTAKPTLKPATQKPGNGTSTGKLGSGNGIEITGNYDDPISA